MVKRMAAKTKRTLALTLVVFGSAWICFAQMMQTAMPAAVASEAPDRHLKGKDNVTREETYQFAFAVARDMRDRSLNTLWGLAPILFGVWLLSAAEKTSSPKSRRSMAREPSNQAMQRTAGSSASKLSLKFRSPPEVTGSPISGRWVGSN